MILTSTFSQISKRKKLSKLKASIFLSCLHFQLTETHAMEAVFGQEERAAPAEPNEIVRYVKAYSYQNPRQLENIAVVGASYLISPAHEPNKFLRYNNRRLEISDRQDVYSLFQFAPAQDLPEQIMANDDLFHLIAWNNQKIQIEDSEYQRDTIRLKMNSSGSFIIRSQSDERDCRAPYLSYDNQRQHAITGRFGNTNAPREFIWTFKPAFDFSQNLKAEEGLPLYKIPTTEKISNLSLTLTQVRDLYHLHFRQTHPDLIFLKATDSYILAAPKSLSSFKKLSFYSSEFNFEIKGLRGIKTKIKEEGKVDFPENISALDLERKKEFIIFFDWNQLHRIQSVEFHPYFSKNDKKNPISLGEILSNIFNNNYEVNKGHYVLQYAPSNKKVKFLDGNKNALLNPGIAPYVISTSFKNATQDSLQTVQQFSTSLEKASENFKQGLIISSRNLSEGLIISSRNLSEGMQISSQIFQKTVNRTSKDLSLCLQLLSKDAVRMSNNLRFVMRSAEHNLQFLCTTVREVSNDLRTSSSEASRSLESSASLFNQALVSLSGGLENSSSNISGSLTEASRNFTLGMKELEKAARAIPTQHNVDVDFGCSIQ